MLNRKQMNKVWHSYMTGSIATTWRRKSKMHTFCHQAQNKKTGCLSISYNGI